MAWMLPPVGLDASKILIKWEHSIWAENDRTQSRQYKTPSFYPHRGGMMGEGRNKEVFGQKQPTILVHQLQIFKKIKRKEGKKPNSVFFPLYIPL